jgi:DNA topoisomerase II
MPNTEKTIEQKYQKKTQKEHILDRPDSYIGDIKKQTDILWTFNPENNRMHKKTVEYVPGLLKIFDEILVNAADNTKEDETCDTIKVSISKEENTISVWNNGKGIDVELHKEHKVLVPEMIFGELLTSTNYDDTEQRVTGGRNGYGAKLANIYSLEFDIEVVDKARCKKFKQTFSDNMSNKTKPKVTAVKNPKSGYTQIIFKPDLKRFGLSELTDDIVNLMIKRVYDIAATTERNIKVFYNSEKIAINTFKSYVSLFYEEENIIYEDVNDRWSVGVLYLPDNGHDQISYANCISTFKGGNHVKYVEGDIIKKIEDQIMKKNKNIHIRPQNIKENLVFFINAVIVNPAFTSQTKEELKTKQNEFGSKCELSDVFIKKILKTGIADQVLLYAKLKEESMMKKKTDGKKVNNIRGIPKLEDANWAGTKKSSECKLILTEGDSAKAFAMAGRSVIGNDKYGIFPLKGKLLNVRDASPKQLLENEELKNVKQILGLQQGKSYNSLDELRYGGIIILTDQDPDGFHIKGLLINVLHYFWPSLVKLNLFIYALATPIVKVSKNKDIRMFYNISDYDNWKEENNTKGWHIKYYKGLGTSNSKEAKEYFESVEEKLIKYTWETGGTTNDPDSLQDSEESGASAGSTDSKKKKPKSKNNFEATIEVDSDDETTESIKLAFEKKRADDRKEWLLNYDKDVVLDNDQKIVPIPEFIHKELKHFSNDDLHRSIPALCDGLKISTRKILYSAFLRKLHSKKDELRVSQLAGFVSDKTCYHHGEQSLCDAIVGMSQDYVGSNNINLLHPSGQFGTRLLAGKDKASARYIHSYLEKLTKFIFRSEDEPILNYLNDDGVAIEPEQYYPIIPMVLVNGAEGIGTGFSTSIPCYNPEDIIKNIFSLMDAKKVKTMSPWYNNFRGKILKVDENTYDVYGKYDILDANRIIVNELPLGWSTTPYKEFLETIQYDADSKKNVIVGFTDNNTDERVHFVVSFPDKKLSLYQNNDTIESKLKLVRKLKTSNMNLFNENGIIQTFNNVEDILEQWYTVRLKKYEDRKKYIIAKIENELDLLKYKALFIKYVLDGTIVVFKQKKQLILDNIVKLKFPQLSTNKDEDKSYDYIINIPLFHLTLEKIDELNNKLKEKEEELAYVKTTPSIDVWRKELTELLKLYTSWHNEKAKEFESNISGNVKITTLKKKTSIKRKKSKTPKTSVQTI